MEGRYKGRRESKPSDFLALSIVVNVRTVQPSLEISAAVQVEGMKERHTVHRVQTRYFGRMCQGGSKSGWPVVKVAHVDVDELTGHGSARLGHARPYSHAKKRDATQTTVTLGRWLLITRLHRSMFDANCQQVSATQGAGVIL